MLYVWSNFAESTLAAAIEADDAILLVADGDGDLFPEPGVIGEQFTLVLENEDASVREIVVCTSRDGDQLSVTRGQEQTGAVAWAEGTVVRHQTTAEALRWMSAAALDFNRKFIGYGAVNPTTDGNGDELQVGAMFYNTQDREFLYWDGDEWTQMIGVGGGAEAFTDLNDVPPYYTGYEGFLLRVRADGLGLEFVESPAVHIANFVDGVPGDGDVLIRYVVPAGTTIVFPDDFSTSKMDVPTAATAPATFAIKHNTATIGSCVVTGTTPVFSTTGTTVTAVAGDVIEVFCPTSADATLADFTMTLVGEKQ